MIVVTVNLSKDEAQIVRIALGAQYRHGLANDVLRRQIEVILAKINLAENQK